MGHLNIRYTLCELGRHFTCEGCTCACHGTAEEPRGRWGRYTVEQQDAAAWDLACYFAPLHRQKLAALIDTHAYLLVAA